MSSHVDVYTRLQPSPIHGIGVFAILHIPAGTKLFTSEEEKWSFVTDARIKTLPESIQRLYKDFAIKEGAWWKGPLNFDDMGAAWYINHSKEPNIVISPGWQYVALRHIEVGEEITVDYDTYSPLEP